MGGASLIGGIVTPLLAGLLAAQVSPPAEEGAAAPVSEPVISREELATDVPPLPAEGTDPDPPLESIPEFERRMEAAIAEPSSPPPSSDPQMVLPLPPLEQFDVEEVEFAQPALATPDATLLYVVRLEGWEQADAATEADLAGLFNDLSALEEGEGEAANEAMLKARLAEDAELVRTLLESEGWYSASVSTRIDSNDAADGGPVVALLQVNPGDRYRIGTITIAAGPTVPPGLIADNLPIEVGDAIVAERIQAAEANVAVALPEHGYPFAEVGQRDVLLDPETDLGDYTLPVETGPRARFDGIRTTGDLAFGADHIGVIARFERGELYDSSKVDDLRQALIATGLFNVVAVEPQRTGEPAGDGTEYVAMLVRQDAGPPRTLAATAGYETGQGFRLEGSWTHRNFLPPEGALTVSAVAGTSEQGAAVTFRRSNFGKRDRTLQLGLDARRSRYDAFDALTGRLAARLSYDSTPIWRKPLTWAVGAEILGSIEEDYDFAAAERRKRRYLIAGLNGQVGIDQTDSLLDPTKGFRAQALIQPEAAFSAGFQPYVRGQLDGSAYYPIGESLVVAGRARVGSTLGIDRAELAPSRRFYGGGGGSVRGFGYQQLGPKAPNGDPIGGLSLVEGSAELRYRFGDYGVVGFVDAGQSYADRVPTLSDIRVGVGIGARYYTNFGPLRIDVATPLGRRDGESRFNVYVSIGQAF